MATARVSSMSLPWSAARGRAAPPERSRRGERKGFGGASSSRTPTAAAASRPEASPRLSARRRPSLSPVWATAQRVQVHYRFRRKPLRGWTRTDQRQPARRSRPRNGQRPAWSPGLSGHPPAEEHAHRAARWTGDTSAKRTSQTVRVEADSSISLNETEIGIDVECLACGFVRAAVRRSSGRIVADECRRCGDPGWAPVGAVNERDRRVLRGAFAARASFRLGGLRSRF